MTSKHLEHILQFVYLIHTLLGGPPGAVAGQPVSEYGLTCAWLSWGVRLKYALSTFVRGLRRQVHSMVADT